MKLGKREIAKLQAIRGGPISSSEFGERFSNSMGLSTLLKKGLITLNDGIYKITELGREICPNRVKNMPPAVKSVTKKPSVYLMNLLAFPPTRAALKIESENDMTTKKTETPTALLMLQCIGAYPDLTMPEIAKLIGKDCGPSYIPSYIERGHVLIELNDKQKKTYRLADGMTAQQVYDYKYNKKDQDLKLKIANRTTTMSRAELKNEADQMQVEIARQRRNELLEAASGDSTSVDEIPEFLLSKDAIKARAKAEILHRKESRLPELTIGYEAALDETASQTKVRFAFTSEQTLIIQGVSYQDIELTQEQTEALFEFVESASLMMPSTGSFSLGAAKL